MAAPMTRAAMKDWLKVVSLFAELSGDELEMLSSTARSMTAKKHARIFEEGTPGDCCFVLTSGRARVVIGGPGDSEITLATLRPKDLVGEIALLNRSTRLASLVAVDDCHFIRIPADSFERLRKNSSFENKVVAHISTTLRRANDQVRGMASDSTIARVAWCLDRIARQEGTADGTFAVITRRTHQELAEMIGCARETVSRKLEALKRKKCLSWDKDTMRIDLEKLQRYVPQERGAPGHWT
jgi:CRP/FNR family transcriptional regulator, cyclic AMP receptor protein